jgi:hypothetical protein
VSKGIRAHRRALMAAIMVASADSGATVNVTGGSSQIWVSYCRTAL